MKNMSSLLAITMHICFRIGGKSIYFPLWNRYLIDTLFLQYRQLLVCEIQKPLLQPWEGHWNL